MLIEKELEQALIGELSAQLSAVQFVGSRSVAEEGQVLTEREDVDSVIAIGTGYRTHEAFSLPMIDIKVTISVCTRVEQDPTGQKHEQIIEKLSDILSLWHFNGFLMEQKLSGSQFVAGELRMTGGTGRTQDKVNSIWSESLTFEIRGTQKFNNSTLAD